MTIGNRLTSAPVHYPLSPWGEGWGEGRIIREHSPLTRRGRVVIANSDLSRPRRPLPEGRGYIVELS